MKYKLLVLDLDDTLLGDDLSISQENINAIRRAREEGVAVVLASGRAPIAMKKYFKTLQIQDYGICYNGAMVLELETLKPIFQKNVPLDDAKILFNILKEYDVDIQTYIGNTLYVQEFKSSTEKYCEMTGMVAQVVDLHKDISQDVVKILVVGEHQYLQKVQQEIEPKVQERLHVFFSKPHYLEFTNIHANKGLAVAHLAKSLGIKREEVICVGDGFNDSYMINYAGLGVAMGNAHEDIKNMADYVTKTNTEHGVAHVIKEFIL